MLGRREQLGGRRALDDPAGAGQNYAGHLQNGFDFAAQKIVDSTTGGDGAYDGPFYRLRSPVERIKDVRVPVAITGGWSTAFTRRAVTGQDKAVLLKEALNHTVWNVQAELATVAVNARLQAAANDAARRRLPPGSLRASDVLKGAGC